MRRSVENAEHVGLFVPTIMDSPPTRTITMTRTLLPTPPRSYQQRQGRVGTFMPPARAAWPPAAVLAEPHAWFPIPQSSTQAPTRQPRPILTPSTSTESLNQAYTAGPATPTRTGTVDTRRADDPFVGSRTIRRPNAHVVQPQRENIPLLC
jgi:hypothetical protein